MKFFRATAIFFLFLLSITSFAQQASEPDKENKNNTTSGTPEEDKLPMYSLPTVVIGSSAMSAADRAKYNRLKRNVLKVLPYARYARTRYNKLQQDLALTSNNREQKKLIKACEQQIKDMFNREVKNLTITQGGILIKLIDRETGYSSYELIKDLEGGFKAFFYQSVARIVGHNLKNQYDAQEERDIESIIIASGYN